MKQKLRENKSKFLNSTNNKIILEEQIIIDKEEKFKHILNFVLSVTSSLTSNRKPDLQNYFYFNGCESGLTYSHSV